MGEGACCAGGLGALLEGGTVASEELATGVLSGVGAGIVKGGKGVTVGPDTFSGPCI